MMEDLRKNTAARIWCAGMLTFALLAPFATAQEGSDPAKKKEQGTMVRILCVQSLTDNQKIILASRNEEGDWKEHGNLTLRSPFITDWMKIPEGVTHLAKREGEGLVSLGSFKVTPQLKSAVLVLLPDFKRSRYAIRIVDPTKLGFKKGKALVINFSEIPALVSVGGKSRTVVAPGQQSVAPIATGDDRMYRMLVGYADDSNKLVACYDRYVSANPQTRKFILIFPDRDSRLRVFTLSEFGPFE